jgi:transcriptional regulator with XRE-family HTH domain
MQRNHYTVVDRNFNSTQNKSNMEQTINFKRILKNAMKKKGLNQLTFAKLLGVRQSQVSNWLNGKSLPGYYSVRQICIVLNISADELLELN